MSPDVAKWLKAIGAKDMTTPGSINLLRHIYVAYHFPEDEVNRLGLTGPEIKKQKGYASFSRRHTGVRA